MSLTGLSSDGTWTNDQYVGNAVDPTGLTFTATYDNGDTASVSPQAHTPTTWGDTAGTQTCTFSYTEGGITKTCDVEATVLAVELDSITISVASGGHRLRAQAYAAVNTQDQIVTAHYTDGSTADVTADATCVSQTTNTDHWGSALVLNTDHWINTKDNYLWSYTEDGVTKTATLDAGFLRGQYEANTASDAIELTNTANEYVTFNVTTFPVQEDYVFTDPYDGSSGGYLIEGATAGDWVWMSFTKDQYDNDTAVTISTFAGLIPAVGAVTGDAVGAPAWGNYVTSTDYNHYQVGCNAVDGNATETLPVHIVNVFGKLTNNIDPAVGIKKSDFISTGDAAYKTYYVDLVTGE